MCIILQMLKLKPVKLLLIAAVILTYNILSQKFLMPTTWLQQYGEFSAQASSKRDFDILSNTKMQSAQLSTPSLHVITKSNQVMKDNVSDGLSFLPICEKYAHETSNRLVIPRRAYYDHRNVWMPQKGNVVILLTEMNDLAVNTIKACKINGNITISRVEIINSSWVRKKFPHITYFTVLIECLFVPSEALVHGSKVHLIHKQETDDCYSQVESEQPLVVKHLKPGFVERGPSSVIICISVFKRPQFFNEWLKYQKHIGIDRVHIAADPSFSVNATSAYPYLREALDSGFATMEVWNNPLGKKVFYYSQILKLQDCVMQNEGIFQYGLLLDSDEFFNPLIPTQKSIGFYMRKHYQFANNVATVCFKWVKYFCQVHPYRAVDTGNLTATLDNLTDVKIRPERKCIHKLSNVLSIGIHRVNIAVKGFYTRNAGNTAYIAHFRPIHQC